MRLIERNNLKILVPEEGKLLKDKNDNGYYEELEDGTKINEKPSLSDEIYLGIQIQTLEEAQELYEEVDYEEESN